MAKDSGCVPSRESQAAMDKALGHNPGRSFKKLALWSVCLLFGLALLGRLVNQDNHTSPTKQTANPAAEVKPAPAAKPSPRQVEVVSNSPWDGSVYQVERWLKKNLKDPDSYQGIDWYEVQKVSDPKTNGVYVVRHKYRAKNSFGGYVIEDAMFSLDAQGNVLSAVKLR